MSLAGFYYEKNRSRKWANTSISYGNQFRKSFFVPRGDGFE